MMKITQFHSTNLHDNEQSYQRKLPQVNKSIIELQEQRKQIVSMLERVDAQLNVLMRYKQTGIVEDVRREA